jgi:hypothetical protein
MFGVVEKIEGGFVVIEDDDGKILHIERHLLPENVREGDVINLDDMTINEEETGRRKDYVRSLIDELFEDE